MPFADELLGDRVAAELVAAVAAVVDDPALPALRVAAADLAGRPLRERSDLLRDALLHDLPTGYAAFAATVRAALHGGLPFGGWLIWPVSTAVAARAVEDGGTAAFDDAMALLAELTPRLTSEFAVRVLLDRDLDRALAIVGTWTASPDEHVRRLASEGTRPFLPWARRVPGILADPRATIPVLDALYGDESEYVRRSVANHLNDLSRHHPELVVETATRWLAAPGPDTARLVRHALRTLVKQGDTGALALLGFGTATALEVSALVLAASDIPFGGTVRFSATITNTAAVPARIAVDYVVHHRKADGSLRGKTFKLTTATLAPGESRVVSRDHSFREVTTRRYHPGGHAIELQLNGVRTGRTEFTLLPGSDPRTRRS
ncbi:DNA alkylation repair protein [Dactylosporangium fulvum]